MCYISQTMKLMRYNKHILIQFLEKYTMLLEMPVSHNLCVIFYSLLKKQFFLDIWWLAIVIKNRFLVAVLLWIFRQSNIIYNIELNHKTMLTIEKYTWKSVNPHSNKNKKNIPVYRIFSHNH